MKWPNLLFQPFVDETVQRMPYHVFTVLSRVWNLSLELEEMMNRWTGILSLFLIFGLSTHMAAEEARTGDLRHVVVFKFKDSANSGDIQKIATAFRDLKNKIPQIVSFEAGQNISPEGLDKGFTHAFILTFLSENDRDIYLEHPDHKAFGRELGPFLADVLVVDFWAD